MQILWGRHRYLDMYCSYIDIHERLDRQKMGEKRAEIETAFGGSHVNVEFVTARWLTLHLSTRISSTSSCSSPSEYNKENNIRIVRGLVPRHENNWKKIKEFLVQSVTNFGLNEF